jgi:hypothetical protein
VRRLASVEGYNVSGFILPFDQAALYNIIAELLAGETIAHLKHIRSVSSAYSRRVAKAAAASARANDIRVNARMLERIFKSDDFWDALSINDTAALEALLAPVIEDKADEEEPAALVAAELILAAVQQLPTDQRLQVSQLYQLRSKLGEIHASIQELRSSASGGFHVISQQGYLNDASNDRSGLQPSMRLASTSLTMKAVEICLIQLVSLQYPWGEWSDRRTELESIIAERLPRQGALIPKPNVARTLFALEALDLAGGGDITQARRRGLEWMRSNIGDGWFWEWAEGQTSHSETRIPEAVRRADIRHTAQALTALSRWEQSRDPLASLVRSVSMSILPNSGFWPNNPRGETPRLLSTVYAVEALERIINNVFRLPLSDIVDRDDASRARSSLRQGLGALLDDCEQGEGLLGSVTSSPNPYLTGLALFRLGYLANKHSELAELITLMVNGLFKTVQEFGWEDSSVPPPLRPATRLRTTLRCSAGLARTNSAGVSVPPALLEHSAGLAEKLVTSSREDDLDSPDYACGLISVRLLRSDLTWDILSDSLRNKIELEHGKHIGAWRKDIQSLTRRVRPLAELDIPGYEQVLKEYQARLSSLF